MTATLTIPEAAELFGIGVSTAYRLAQRDEFPVPVIRFGRTLRVSRARVEQLLDAPLDPPPPAELPGGTVHVDPFAALEAAATAAADRLDAARPALTAAADQAAAELRDRARR